MVIHSYKPRRKGKSIPPYKYRRHQQLKSIIATLLSHLYIIHVASKHNEVYKTSIEKKKCINYSDNAQKRNQNLVGRSFTISTFSPPFSQSVLFSAPAACAGMARPCRLRRRTHDHRNTRTSTPDKEKKGGEGGTHTMKMW